MVEYTKENFIGGGGCGAGGVRVGGWEGDSTVRLWTFYSFSLCSRSSRQNSV